MPNLLDALSDSENTIDLQDENLITPIHEFLEINPEKRLITIPESEQLFGVYGENKVEIKYFKCPRIILNDIDLYECYIFINYISASGKIGYIQADTVVLDETENYIIFTWELTRNVFDENTDADIYFSISAKQYLEDKEPVFFTRKAKGNLYETVYAEEQITEQYADIILQLLAEMDGVKEIATPEAMQAYVDNWLKENPSVIGGNEVFYIASVSDFAKYENGFDSMTTPGTYFIYPKLAGIADTYPELFTPKDGYTATVAVMEVGTYEEGSTDALHQFMTIYFPVTVNGESTLETMTATRINLGESGMRTWKISKGDLSNIFIAEYGTTALDEILGSLRSGKSCFCNYGNTLMSLISYGSASVQFGCFSMSNARGESAFYTIVTVNSSGWIKPEVTKYTKTSEISESSTNDEIPTALAVQDAVGKLSQKIADKATLEDGVIKFYKKATTEDGTNTELFSVDLSSIGGTGGLNLENLTLSVSQVGEYQRLSMSDGTTTKTVDIPITAISDDQVQTAVNTWLDNNPDAISTSVDGKIHIASQWNNPRKTVETKTGRINIFENASKSLIEINTDISDKTVIVHGVNYFDYNDLVSGAIVASTGVIKNSTTDFYTEHLIPIEPNKILYWNRNNEENTRSYLSIHFYDKNQTWISCNTIGSKTMAQKFVPSSEAYYMRVSCASLIDAKKEKLLIADIDVGDTKYGYTNSGLIVTAEPPYFGKTTYIPYIGYRIENGALIGASNTYTVEELTHVDVFETESVIEVSMQMEVFSTKKLSNVQLKFGRYADTDYVMARIFKYSIDGGTVTPKLFVKSPGGIKLKEYAKENDFIMAINAGSFDTDDNSCIGTTIVDGVVLTDHLDHIYVGSCDVLTIDSSGNLKSYPYETTTDALLSAGVVHAVQGKCTLIDNYAKYDMETADTLLGNDGLVNAKHPRTAIGQFKNGDYMVFTCGGRETNQAGMTCGEMQELFVSEGLKYAYNLDGGGSCNMWFYKKELAPYTENRADPTHIVFN